MNLAHCQDLLISLGVRSTILAGLIWLGWKLAKHRSADFRCGILTMGMLGLGLLPLSLCLPRFETNLLPNFLAAAPSVGQGNESAGGSTSPWVLLWFGGIGFLCLCQSLGVWRLERWRRASRPLEDGYWQAAVADVREALGYRGRIDLRTCDSLRSPVAAGLWHPCVYLPQDARTWGAERLRVVLLHEVGHLKRRDLWTQWLCQYVCALYWFHPLVWILKHKLHCDREHACDETVLNSGTEPKHYARHLVELAQTLSTPATPRLAITNGLFLAMASPAGSPLEDRVRGILAFQGRHRMPVWISLTLLTLGMSAVWATATLSPASQVRVESGTAHDGLGVSNAPVITAKEVHFRLTADPFPAEG